MIFKRYLYLDGKYRSIFSILFSKHIICRILGHKWEWWQIIERNKCNRCLSSNSKDNALLETFDKFSHKRQENIYRKLQTPFWKLAGMQLTPQEREQERYMQAKGLDYYDVQRIRDSRNKAKARRGVVDGRSLKPAEVTYRRGE